MRKSIQLRGIGRDPSDRMAGEGSASESRNIYLDNGECAPMLAPALVTGLYNEGAIEYIYIHKMRSATVYIGLLNNSLYAVTGATLPSPFLTLGQQDNNIVKIESIGNTLIVATETSLYYSLWKNGAYTFLGFKLPELDYTAIEIPYTQAQYNALGLASKDVNIQFNALKALQQSSYIALTGEDPGEVLYALLTWSELVYDNSDVIGAFLEPAKAISDAFWEYYTASVGKAHKKGILCNPIFVRLAFRLYDGSHVMQTAPILLDPEHFSKDRKFDGIVVSGTDDMPAHTNLSATGTVNNAYTPYHVLLRKIGSVNLSAWADIITGIDVYFSDEIHLTKIGSEVTGFSDYVHNNGSSDHTATFVLGNKVDEITEFSNFYLVKSIDLADLTTNIDIPAEDIKDRLGDNLTVQNTLEDDYHSNNWYAPEYIYAYNKRLNMSGVSERYMGWYPAGSSVKRDSYVSEASQRHWYYRFYIKADTGEHSIVTCRNVDPDFDSDGQQVGRTFSGYPGPWIFYPDANCYKVDVIYNQQLSYNTGDTLTYKYITIDMKPHPGLNGSYAFLGWKLLSIISNQQVKTFGTTPPAAATPSLWRNKLFQSEVNNPFNFRPENIHTLPSGEIIGMAAATVPISTGQFGQYPLYVFSTDGIWAMGTTPTGTYATMVPFRRDVCTDAASITPMDNAVAFVSSRGLMLISGGDCVNISEFMNGEHYVLTNDIPTTSSVYSQLISDGWRYYLPSDIDSFLSFLNGARIAYDYKNNRILVANDGKRYIYVYQIASHTWHTMSIGGSLIFSHALNNYPDCYLVCRSDDLPVVFNMSSGYDVTTGTALRSVIVTRPLDLGYPDVRKAIRSIRMRGKFDNHAGARHMQYILLGSMDGQTYGVLPSLRAGSFKYYKLVLLSTMSAEERLSYVDIDFDIRYDDKLR